MLGSLSNQFVFSLPSDFVPQEIETLYRATFKKNRMLHSSVVDYLNATIKSITLPSVSYSVSTQTIKRGKEVEWRPAVNVADAMTRQLDVVFASYDSHFNYFVMKHCLDWHYLNTASNYVEPITVTAVDRYRNPVMEYEFRSVLCRSLSELPLSYADLRAEERTFTVQFSYTWFGMKYMVDGVTNTLTMDAEPKLPSEYDREDGIPASILANNPGLEE